VVYRNSASSLKNVQNPCQFFLFIFLIILVILMKPNRVKPSLGLVQMCQEAAVKISDFVDKRAKSYACFTEDISSYVFRKAQHGGSSSGS